ncbi:50S ribosome-binding GTPase [Candidatus Pacearchaeota archaeon]|nr:50S ribosome-binding GTPase [Candidatus Pacearchaeota archaeon]
MRAKYIFSSKFTQKFRKPPYTNQHKVKFQKLAKEVISQSDIVLEILDSRFIDKTRNRELEQEVKSSGKKLIFILNKADLIDINDLKFNKDLNELKPYVLFSSKNKIGRKRLREIINIEASRIKFPKARVGLIGYPNTGKSSIINVLSGGKKTRTSSQAGFTTSIQKIRFNNKVIILDSPGVIPNREETSIDAEDVKEQSEMGAKNLEKVKNPDIVVHMLMRENPGVFDNFYKTESDGDSEILIENLGKKWKILKKRGIVDTDKTARKILKDWQSGKFRKT